MTRKLASIVEIKTSVPVKDADFLDVTRMVDKGWNVITRRGEFKPGDRAVYFEIDSALPPDDPRYGFLRAKCLKHFRIGNPAGCSVIRIRSIKLRGITSQGLLLPIEQFPEAKGKKPGDDMTEILGVQNYDELVQKYEMASISGNPMGLFPGWMDKTDEERIQNMTELFDNQAIKDMEFEVTEKYDGTSATFMYAPEFSTIPFFVCSRNLRLHESNGNVFWKIARNLNLEEKLTRLYREDGKSYAVQGEIVGPNISSNRDHYNDYELFVFRIKDLTLNRWLTHKERYDLYQTLGLKHAKVIEPAMKVFTELPTLEDMLQFVEGKTDNGNDREGMVFKSKNYSLSFKCISNAYLLKMK